MAKLALIGDYSSEVVAHVAIPQALQLARDATSASLEWVWIGTEQISDAARDLAGYAGVWVVSGSPYKNMDGALAAIRHAREQRLPFLGTCGGFQHALIEVARNVAKISEADHAESNATGTDLVVTPLACSLVGQSGDISFTPGSRMHGIFRGQTAREEYRCNFGLNWYEPVIGNKRSGVIGDTVVVRMGMGLAIKEFKGRV